MSPSTTLLLLIATSTFFSSCVAHGPTPRHQFSTRTGNCMQHEREALLEFKKGITGDPAGRLASWRKDERGCCRWTGVRCSNLTGHVVGLNLRTVQTKDGETALEGQISPSLISLHHLEHLDLSQNNLSGPAGHLPEFLGLLKNLRYLNLSGTALRIPPQLGNLSNLHYLDLSDGPTIYTPDISWITNLPLLYLNMDSVNLSRTPDWAYMVNMVPSLKVLRLTSCSLASANQSLPYLNLTGLQELSLSRNSFAHPVASCWFWNLTSLQHLELSGTSLRGQVPNVLGGMTSLHVLDFSFSYWGIDIMKANMTNLCNLESLDLSYDSLNGDVIESLLPHCSTNKLKELHLGDNNLTGTIPYWIGRRWSSLHILELNSNKLTGPVPSEMGMLSNLVTLDLSDNEITGPVPSEIGMLSNLVSLVLSRNKITGPVPSEIGSLNNLLYLDLSSNQFNGSMPSEIGMLNNLLSLDLSCNEFTEPVPSEIGMVSNLLILDLSQNQFNGPLPSEISMLNKLTDMDLSNNNLTGVITHEHLAGLTNLTTIDLSGNYLKITVDPEWLPRFRLEYANFATCNMGPLFPVWLRAQEEIVDLNMSRASIFNKLPNWVFTAYSKAWILDFSNNGINGTLPNNLENMTSLEILYLNSNRLTGSVPQLPINLKELDISENSFSGPLSSNFRTENLEYLSLASNHFTGPIPHSICQIKDLGQLNLANNYFDGEFPLCTEPGGYRILILRNNRLTGKFPSSLKIWTDLYILDLAWNKFSGRLPMWIGDFTELGILQLSQNMFTGSIPATITRLQQLSQLNLAGNMLSGPLPRYLSNLTRMTRVYSPTFSAFMYPRPGHFFERHIIFDVNSKNITVVGDMIIAHVNLSVITKGQERYYKDGELHGMVTIDLSSNQLSGEIPEEITSLDGLVNLNLSLNQLCGKIPRKIGAMQSLESLDLKGNKLYGEIPGSLSNITYLSYLDLSYNNLTGSIPSGGQLDTLYEQYPFMYNGNGGLCGHPLQKNCSNSSEPVHGDDHGRDEYDSKLLSFSFGLGVGFVVGVWVVFIVFLFKKSWMAAYFLLVDVAFDNIYVFVVVTCSRWAKGQQHIRLADW